MQGRSNQRKKHMQSKENESMCSEIIHEISEKDTEQIFPTTLPSKIQMRSLKKHMCPIRKIQRMTSKVVNPTSDSGPK